MVLVGMQIEGVLARKKDNIYRPGQRTYDCRTVKQGRAGGAGLEEVTPRGCGERFHRVKGWRSVLAAEAGAEALKWHVRTTKTTKVET